MVSEIKESHPYRLYLEGEQIRVFKHNGEVKYSSTNYVNCPDKILDMYRKLGGPKDPFDEKKKYSSYCYIFTLSQPDRMYVSKIRISDIGVLSYIDTIKLFDRKSNKFPEDEVDFEIKKLKITNDINTASREKILYQSSVLCKEEAEKYLFPEDNFGQGEIVMYKHNDRFIKLIPENYTWRMNVLGEKNDLKLRFYHLLKDIKYGNEKYLSLYPNLIGSLNYSDVRESILVKGYINLFHDDERDIFLKFDKKVFSQLVEQRRIFNNLMIMLCCSNGYDHVKLINIYDEYVQCVESTVDAVEHISNEGVYRYNDILAFIVKKSKELVKMRKCKDIRTAAMKMVTEERGVNLYRMFKSLGYFSNGMFNW
uniref:RNA ligase with polynucleotide kinase domain n=1 Tax=Pithovirus LCPAC403 TaxID=2506596 RepID=A0A481ZCG1_9VIRU|nr:MAG: RNA ligase with polynucleotide kinase domain [Pithovirus LCPAC403]